MSRVFRICEAVVMLASTLFKSTHNLSTLWDGSCWPAAVEVLDPWHDRAKAVAGDALGPAEFHAQR